ncbi:putative defense protein Hdd11 [Spea bombifrons]|uniref:putative defense protein Hdd11 n=1 Tax=Spea bombifrons TaxID=233779 RepID=UPI00234B7B30|nr:putative defense protein Hdd11 [Spea bombifrons]
MDGYLQKILIIMVMVSPLRVVAYPNGRVEAACSSMVPNHGVPAQTSSPPYTLNVSKTTYSAGERLTVTLSTNPGATSFAGFLIQARAGTNSTPVGYFETSNADTQTLTCTTPASAVSHTSRTPKQSIQVTWVAPSTNIPDIAFRATVVQTGIIFWTDLASSTLTFETSVANNTTDNATTTAISITGSYNATATPNQSNGFSSGSRLSMPAIHELLFLATFGVIVRLGL